MLIGVDWGTTRLRAYLVGDDGSPVARRETDDGLTGVASGGFAAVLERAVGGWLADVPRGTPVLLSGMVGSRQGWVEAPYVGVPATLADLAREAVLVEAGALGDVAIVPGVVVGEDGGEWADVMRGEETEVFGAVAALERTDAMLVLPGTHSKWVTVADGAITHFRTYMTGEVYAAIGSHTILARMLGRDKGDKRAFAYGLAAARELSEPGDLLTRLFTIRAEGLMGRLGDDAAASFLSGLLIGAEVASGGAGVSEAIIVGAAQLAERYATAFDGAGITSTVAPRDCAARGLAMIAAARTG